LIDHSLEGKQMDQGQTEDVGIAQKQGTLVPDHGIKQGRREGQMEINFDVVRKRSLDSSHL
jgi:hypothetical protein